MACQLAWARVPAGLMVLRCIAACWKPGVAAASPPALRLLLAPLHPQACALWMPETFLSYREVPGVGRQEFVAGLEKVKHDRWAGLGFEERVTVACGCACRSHTREGRQPGAQHRLEPCLLLAWRQL